VAAADLLRKHGAQSLERPVGTKVLRVQPSEQRTLWQWLPCQWRSPHGAEAAAGEGGASWVTFEDQHCARLSQAAQPTTVKLHIQGHDYSVNLAELQQERVGRGKQGAVTSATEPAIVTELIRRTIGPSLVVQITVDDDEDAAPPEQASTSSTAKHHTIAECSRTAKWRQVTLGVRQFMRQFRPLEVGVSYRHTDDWKVLERPALGDQVSQNG
jgi:hypothetical protein